MKKKTFLFFVLLIVVLLFAYFDVLLHPQVYYDDISNIFNAIIANKSFDLETVKRVLLFKHGGFRPVSYLSFYLNYLFFGNGIEHLKSYMLINFILHCLNSLLVFFVILKISGNDFKLSSFVTFAWALSPVNSLAVNYIVQRMTELMMFFGFVSFLFFIEFCKKKGFWRMAISLFFLILSVLSKENGILFVVLFLFYLVWFRNLKIDIKKLYVLLILLFLFFVVFTSNYFLPGAILRGFTPFKRLLTESRVIVFYLKNLVVPVPSDIFLYLDFPLSTSLFHPFSTFFSSFFLFGLFLSSYFLFNKNRLASFGVVSFFLFHVLESTTIPLYIAFFHRNYVASVFFFLAFFSFFFKFIKKDFVVFLVTVILVFNFVFVLKVSNARYTSPFYYLKLNYKRFPSNKDLCLEIGRRYMIVGEYRKAIKMFLNSFAPYKLNKRIEFVLSAFFNFKMYNAVINLGRNFNGPIILQIIGKAYKKLGKYKLAEQYFRKSLSEHFNYQALNSYLDLLAKEGRFREIIFLLDRYKGKLENNELYLMYRINSYLELGMLKNCKPLLECLKTPEVYHWLKGKFYFKEGKYKKAIKELNKIKTRTFTPENVFITLQKVILLSECYSKMKDFDDALNVLEGFKKFGFFEPVMNRQIEKVKSWRKSYEMDLQK